MKALLIVCALLFSGSVLALGNASCSAEQENSGCVDSERECRLVPEWQICVNVSPEGHCQGGWGSARVCAYFCDCDEIDDGEVLK